MSLREEVDNTFIDLDADKALVWTSYRDTEGNLIIELPNSVPGPEVMDLSPEGTLVSVIQVDLEESASRPLTRLTVRTRQEADHSLSAEGEGLKIELVPIEATEAVIADSLLPLPTEEEPVVEEWTDLPEEEISQVAETQLAEGQEINEAPPGETLDEDAHEAGAQSVATASPTEVRTEGDLEVTYSRHEVTHPATIVADVEIVESSNSTILKVAGDGEFSYSSFRLENPDRFVIDLAGVVNTLSRSTVPVASLDVDRVRVAQFQPFPDPVSRVVFDLSSGQIPLVQPMADGLLISFSRTPDAEDTTLAEDLETGNFPAGDEKIADPPVTEIAEVVEAEESPDSWQSDSAHQEPEIAQQEIVEQENTQSSDMSEPAISEIEAVSELASESQPEDNWPSYGTEGQDAAEITQVVEEVATEEIEPTQAEAPVAVAEVVDYPESDGLSDVAETESFEQLDEAALQPVEVAEFQETEVPEVERYEEPTYEAEAPPTDVALFEAAEVEYNPPRGEPENLTKKVSPEVVGGGGRVYSGDPITMSLKDADIKDVLRSFSGITGLNVVVHPGVKGSVTVELTEVPWDQALDLILKINSLDYVLEGNIMRIATTSQLEREANDRRRLAAARAQEVPLTTVIRSISYAKASQIARLLTTSATSSGGNRGRGANRANRSILSTRGSVAVDQRTNRLILKELPSNMNTVLAIIDNLDTAEPQVLIEARIVETNKTFSRSLGINWGITAVADNEFGNTTGLAFPNRARAQGGVQLFNGGNNGFLNIALGNVLDTFVLDASLQAAENEGLVSVVASPRVTVLNNERADIQSGLQIPIQTVSNNTVSVQFVNATLILSVTPQVTAEGTVLLDILVAKREPQLAFAIAGATNAPISTRQARTRVIVRDGDTTVIGGIYEISNNRGEDRVPGLANVPLLGQLFKNRRRSTDNDELLIFITPRIIQL
ncbi:MAG: type IV pilus secretin PilQ [Deltaproteobacteria bacterium]|nr:type IV pilus secretin PilQ [Deltaproteobacteria bacterium]